MDGRRGLVPITYIQRLSAEELAEFNQRVLIGMKEMDDCLSTAIPHDIESIPAGKYYLPFIKVTMIIKHDYFLTIAINNSIFFYASVVYIYIAYLELIDNLN